MAKTYDERFSRYNRDDVILGPIILFVIGDCCFRNSEPLPANHSLADAVADNELG